MRSQLATKGNDKYSIVFFRPILSQASPIGPQTIIIPNCSFAIIPKNTKKKNQNVLFKIQIAILHKRPKVEKNLINDEE